MDLLWDAGFIPISSILPLSPFRVYKNFSEKAIEANEIRQSLESK